MNFEEIKCFAVTHGELPEEVICDDCGLALLTLEQSHELERVLAPIWETPSRPVRIDICECG